jgi:hypothetical protein
MKEIYYKEEGEIGFCIGVMMTKEEFDQLEHDGEMERREKIYYYQPSENSTGTKSIRAQVFYHESRRVFVNYDPS